MQYRTRFSLSDKKARFSAKRLILRGDHAGRCRIGAYRHTPSADYLRPDTEESLAYPAQRGF